MLSPILPHRLSALQRAWIFKACGKPSWTDVRVEVVCPALASVASGSRVGLTIEGGAATVTINGAAQAGIALASGELPPLLRRQSSVGIDGERRPCCCCRRGGVRESDVGGWRCVADEFGFAARRLSIQRHRQTPPRSEPCLCVWGCRRTRPFGGSLSPRHPLPGTISQSPFSVRTVALPVAISSHWPLAQGGGVFLLAGSARR